MNFKRKWKQRLISFFFVDENMSEEERLKEELAANRFMFKVFTIVFLLNFVWFIYLLFKDGISLNWNFDFVQFIITIAFGVGALYYDRKIR